MVLPAADTFFNCLTYGILGLFQRVHNARAKLGGVGCSLLAVVLKEETN